MGEAVAVAAAVGTLSSFVFPESTASGTYGSYKSHQTTTTATTTTMCRKEKKRKLENW